MSTHKELRIRREEISQAIKNGSSSSEVARKFKVCIDTVKNACDEFGVDVIVTQFVNREKRERRKAVAQAIKKGISISEAAIKFNISQATVYVACREFDIQPLTNYTKKGNRSFQAIALSQKGLSYRQIAKQLKISFQRIHQIVSAARHAGVSGL